MILVNVDFLLNYTQKHPLAQQEGVRLSNSKD
ncbi:hypothetical protein CUS34_10880 [Enterococcus faecalis]|nr:hypothetical protein [Enterococcus faecalis]PQD11692.1 hypothetical protein CUM65_04115 [Enterococcus faecalis]PQG37193.1 hypothetical protein CUS34_10880 [Enterococcus faecalis]RXV24456.1 hypothetical protein CYQ36_01950 [Enterococcus faecalis]RXV25236.1 hypothetical protein CYQ38_02545 [Enterococcus faecalis]